MKLEKTMFPLAVLAAVSAVSNLYAVTEWPLDRLVISAYYLHPVARTPEHVRGMRECGIDLLVHGMNGDTNTFAMLHENGITTIINGAVPSLGEQWLIPLARQRLFDVYTRGAASFVDHPAVTGIDIGDEPGAEDFPYLGKVAEIVSDAFPGKFPYLNILPNYASTMELGKADVMNQLGTATYEDHVREYLKWMPLNYICYDFYVPTVMPKARDDMVRKCYNNIEVVSDAALRTGRSMANVLLVGARPINKAFPELAWTRENELRFQAYSSMAFGTSMIGWACYGTAWWTNTVIDAAGNRTQQYEKLKRVNGEIHRIAPRYDRLRRTNTRFVGFSSVTNDWLQKCVRSDLPALDSGFFSGLACERPSPLIVGEFVGRTANDPLRAIFVFAADDPFDLHPADHIVRFKCACKVRAFGKDGPIAAEPGADGTVRLPLRSNGFLLVETEATGATYAGSDVRIASAADVNGAAAICCGKPVTDVVYARTSADVAPRLSGMRRLAAACAEMGSVAAACRSTGSRFHYSAGTNARNNALVAMAFGAEPACEGLGEIGVEFAKFRNTATTFVRPPAEDRARLAKVGIAGGDSFYDGYFLALRTEGGKSRPLIVGDMVANDPKMHSRALYVLLPEEAVADRSEKLTLRFYVSGRVTAVYGSRRQTMKGNCIRRVPIRPGEPLMLVLDNQ